MNVKFVVSPRSETDTAYIKNYSRKFMNFSFFIKSTHYQNDRVEHNFFEFDIESKLSLKSRVLSRSLLNVHKGISAIIKVEREKDR